MLVGRLGPPASKMQRVDTALKRMEICDTFQVGELIDRSREFCRRPRRRLSRPLAFPG